MKTKTNITKSVKAYNAVQRAIKEEIEKMRKEAEKAQKEKSPS